MIEPKGKGAPYEVGYGKPPKNTQFKPKQSGNPLGRPKKAATLSEVFEREMRKNVTVAIDGKPIRLSQGEVVIKTLIRKAMNGDLPATRAVLVGWQTLPESPDVQAAVSVDDLLHLHEILSNKIESLKGEAGGAATA